MVASMRPGNNPAEGFGNGVERQLDGEIDQSRENVKRSVSMRLMPCVTVDWKWLPNRSGCLFRTTGLDLTSTLARGPRWAAQRQDGP